ncbi:MAG: hypothetical protein ABIP41_09375 [Croceibacterium sp.]
MAANGRPSSAASSNSVSDVVRMAIYWAAFVTVDLLAGWIAYWLDGHPGKFPPLLMRAAGPMGAL